LLSLFYIFVDFFQQDSSFCTFYLFLVFGGE
jgi:hypothetical protein